MAENNASSTEAIQARHPGADRRRVADDLAGQELTNLSVELQSVVRRFRLGS